MLDKQLSDTTKMKTSMLTFAVITTLTVVILPGCNNSVENTKDVTAYVSDEAAAFEADIEAFKKVAYRDMAAYEISIAKFEDGIAKLAQEDKSDYKKRIFALEKTNQDLRDRMNNYKADGKENWEVFKAEFTHHLNKLDTALMDFTSTIGETNIDL